MTADYEDISTEMPENDDAKARRARDVRSMRVETAGAAVVLVNGLVWDYQAAANRSAPFILGRAHHRGRPTPPGSTPEERRREGFADIQAALDWCRLHPPHPQGVEERRREGFADIQAALDWCRLHPPHPQGVCAGRWESPAEKVD